MVREAAHIRFRPIMMTSVATVAGHFPLTLVTGPGAVARNSIGFVYQADNLLPFLTLLENVGLQLALDGKSSGTGKSLAALASLGLGGLAYRLPDHLSGGQRQRVAVARAIVHEPQIILADEPTGALDTANAAGVIDLLLEMQREIGATLIMVTHDRDAARRLDRQIHLQDGRVS